MADKIKVQEFSFFRWECPYCNSEQDEPYSPAKDYRGALCEKCGHEFNWDSFDPGFEDM